MRQADSQNQAESGPPTPIPVSDRQDPRVAPYTDLRGLYARELDRIDRAGRDWPDLFIAEGGYVVRRLIESAYRVESVLLGPGRFESMAGDLAALGPAVPVYVASRELIRSISGVDMHRGVLAAGVRGPGPDVPSMLRAASACVVLEDVTNHDNIGGIFRSIGALCGKDACVLLAGNSADPLYRKSIRVSMGQALRVPWATLDDLPGSGMDLLRTHGFEPIAMTPAEGSEDLYSFEPMPGSRPAVLLGAEGPGLSENTLTSASRRVRIPIDPQADSLNVYVSGSIALSRLVRPFGAR
ncbi:MAG: RNA methyltransferase [Planctomycetota bacterium]